MTKTDSIVHRHRKGYRRGLILLIVVGIVLYLVVPQLTGLSGAWSTLGQANLVWLGVAIGCLLLTYLVAAGVYLSLSIKRLVYGRTALVQMASMFAGRLLPAGVGALGINYLYLKKQQHSAAQAGAAVTANNTLGFVGNVLLVVALLLTTSTTLPRLHSPKIGLWVLLFAVVFVAGLVIARKTTPIQRLGLAIKAVGKALVMYRRRPFRLLLALGCSVLLTSLYAALLYASSRAIGPELSFGAAVIVMTVGVAGATVTPTPGGIGGAEAALAAALVLYHIPATEAVAIAVLYRLITYWLGLLLGGAALVVVERRNFI